MEQPVKNQRQVAETNKLYKQLLEILSSHTKQTIKKLEKKPKEVQIWFEIPKNLTKYVVKKGSIAIDGISLTVVDIKNNLASVCLIPHTMEKTNFKIKNVGDKVNIETDILGKYILK